MRSQTLLLLVPVVMAATPRIRPASSKGFGGQSKLVNSLAFGSCQTGYVTCEDACMPSDGVCCGDGTDEYCFEGYYCIPNACCPEGEICDGSGVGDAECAIGETECGDLCMPLTGTCCNDGLHYCPDFGTCTDDGYCCDIGDDCYGDDSSSVSTDLPTSTDDDFSFTTATATTTQASTTSFSDDDDETTTTSSRSSTSTSSRSSTTSTRTTATTSTTDSAVTAPPTNPILQQAGGHFTADGKMVVGLAAAAALLL